MMRDQNPENVRVDFTEYPPDFTNLVSRNPAVLPSQPSGRADAEYGDLLIGEKGRLYSKRRKMPLVLGERVEQTNEG